MYFDYELGFIWLFLNLSSSAPLFFLFKFNVICIGLFELLSFDILCVDKLPMFIAGELRLSSKFGWLRRFAFYLRCFLILIFLLLLPWLPNAIIRLFPALFLRFCYDYDTDSSVTLDSYDKSWGTFCPWSMGLPLPKVCCWFRFYFLPPLCYTSIESYLLII